MTPKFDMQELLELAQRQSGLTDWGDDGFREPLGILVKGLNEEARLNEVGVARTKSHLGNILVQRLKLVEDRKRYPAIAKQDIREPLFITGMPRAGTSLLNSLLAQDPTNVPTLHWQMWCPSPPPNDPSFDHTPQIQLARELLDFQGHTSAEMRDKHKYDALNAEEDGHMCEYSLQCSDFIAYWNTPSYVEYLARSSYVPAYQWHKRVLQAMQIGAEGRYWTLKAPGHMYHLEALLEVYPDAKFVLNHRDPSKVLASVLSMIAVHMNLYGNKAGLVNREFLLAHIRDLAPRWEQIMHMRKDPEMNRRFVDVMYVDLVRDPIGQVDRVYAMRGIPLTNQARQSMHTYFNHNRKGKFGTHSYSLADYGVTADEVRKPFQRYLDHFAVPLE